LPLPSRAAIPCHRAQAPAITVPTITLEGDANGAPRANAGACATKFTGEYTHLVVGDGVGHNLPHISGIPSRRERADTLAAVVFTSAC
jgi:hypothetical protein